MKNYVLGILTILVIVLIIVLVYICNVNIASCYVDQNGGNTCISQKVGHYVFFD